MHQNRGKRNEISVEKNMDEEREIEQDKNKNINSSNFSQDWREEEDLVVNYKENLKIMLNVWRKTQGESKSVNNKRTESEKKVEKKRKKEM